ncbi:MAG: hypothetical protein ACYDH4_10680 [Candidatus Cryosericum sp.]
MKREYLVGGALVAVGLGVWFWHKSAMAKQASIASQSAVTTVIAVVPKSLPYTPQGGVPSQAVVISTSADTMSNGVLNGAVYVFPVASLPQLPTLIGKTVTQALPMIASLGGQLQGLGLTLAAPTPAQATMGNLACVGLSMTGQGTGNPGRLYTVVGQGAGQPGRLYTVVGEGYNRAADQITGGWGRSQSSHLAGGMGHSQSSHLAGQGTSPNWRKRGAGATSPRMA